MPTETDPVCGMKVDPDRAAGQSGFAGKTYYFCAIGCKNKFENNPSQYLATKPQTFVQLGNMSMPGAPVTAPVPAKTPLADAREYTCPMHPEIRQKRPGPCPICGMALEPVEFTLEDDTSELRDMQHRLWIGVALTLPLLVLMLIEWLPHHAGQSWFA